MVGEPLVFVKHNDGIRDIMTAFTSTGVITVITDNPHVSVMVEYDNQGELLHYHVDNTPNVKEIK